MSQIRQTLAAAALVVWAATTAGAQTPLALSIDEAIQRGVEHAPGLAAARSREAAAAATVDSRAALGRPTVTASSSYLRTNHVDEFGIPQANGTLRIIFPDIPSNYSVRSEVAVPVYTGGRVASLEEAARSDVRAAGADRRGLEQDVRLDIARAYWALVTARESVRVLEGGLERADASVSDVRARVEAGVLPPNDLLSAQAQRARQSVQLIEARNDAAFAEMDLGRLVGAAPGQPIVTTTAVDTPVTGVSDMAASPVATLVKRAVEQRAEREGLVARQASFKASGEAALAATRPQVAALASIEPARPNQRFVPRTAAWQTSWDLALRVTWPLFDGGRARADEAAATAQAEAVGHQLADFDERIAVDVRQRLLDLSAGRAAVAASSEAVAAATEAHRVVEERFSAGVATSTDVLEAQVALLQAELEQTRLTASLRLAESRLLRVVGDLK
jgi:outer membrane protein